MFRYCFALMFMLLSHLALAAENPDVRELMTEEEFAASGFGRLTDNEIAAINRWLVRYTAQDAEVMIDDSPAVRELSSAAINSRIDGEFSGWNGPTQFRLQNGQIWETRSTRRYSYSAVDPEVEITTNWMGISRMRIVDTDRAIRVRRVE
jgi:hypothetical protein